MLVDSFFVCVTVSVKLIVTIPSACRSLQVTEAGALATVHSALIPLPRKFQPLYAFTTKEYRQIFLNQYIAIIPLLGKHYVDDVCIRCLETRKERICSRK